MREWYPIPLIAQVVIAVQRDVGARVGAEVRIVRAVLYDGDEVAGGRSWPGIAEDEDRPRRRRRRGGRGLAHLIFFRIGEAGTADAQLELDARAVCRIIQVIEVVVRKQQVGASHPDPPVHVPRGVPRVARIIDTDKAVVVNLEEPAAFNRRVVVIVVVPAAMTDKGGVDQGVVADHHARSFVSIDEVVVPAGCPAVLDIVVLLAGCVGVAHRERIGPVAAFRAGQVSLRAQCGPEGVEHHMVH